MFLFFYFGVLVLSMAVMADVLSWPWAAMLFAAMIFVERRFISASHITDGDHASDH